MWLAFAGESGGVSGRWLWRIDPQTGEIRKLDRPIDAGGVITGSGAVWVIDSGTTHSGNQLLKILPGRGSRCKDDRRAGGTLR